MKVELKAYPAYKPSGVEWIGKIPSGWSRLKLRYLIRQKGGGTPSKAKPEYWQGDIPWVSPKDMKWEVIEDSEDHITNEALSDSASSLVEANSVLIVVRSGILRRCIPVAINSIPVALNQDMKALVPNLKLTPRFLMLLILGNQEEFLALWLKRGSTVESLEQSLISDTAVPLPPLAEQHAVVAFLDRETAKIDRLIDVRRNQVERLQEQRIAVIHHAVTQGLNSHAKMKPSGIEWLGDVPVEWRTQPLWTVAKMVVSNVDKLSLEGELPVHLCNYVDVYKNEQIHAEIDFMAATATLAEIRKFGLRKNDVIITKDSENPNDIAIPAIVAETYETLVCGYHLAIFRASFELNAGYLFRLLQTVYMRSYFATKAQGVTRFGLSQNAITHCAIPLPPVYEQEMIVAHIDGETTKLDTLLAKYRRELELLVEYRASLISHAVTGKIDVRGLV